MRHQGPLGPSPVVTDGTRFGAGSTALRRREGRLHRFGECGVSHEDLVNLELGSNIHNTPEVPRGIGPGSAPLGASAHRERSRGGLERPAQAGPAPPVEGCSGMRPRALCLGLVRSPGFTAGGPAFGRGSVPRDRAAAGLDPSRTMRFRPRVAGRGSRLGRSAQRCAGRRVRRRQRCPGARRGAGGDALPALTPLAWMDPAALVVAVTPAGLARRNSGVLPSTSKVAASLGNTRPL